MNDETRTPEERGISFAVNATEVDVEIDDDGDLYLYIANDNCPACNCKAVYLSEEQARELRDYLNKVLPT